MAIAFTGVTVTNPAGKGCKVKGAKIETTPLEATTAGQGMALLLSAAEGEDFLSFTIEGRSNEILNTSGWATGAVGGVLDGSTLSFSEEATTKAGLGDKRLQLGFEASLALTDRSESPEPFTPLGFTTVET